MASKTISDFLNQVPITLPISNPDPSYTLDPNVNTVTGRVKILPENIINFNLSSNRDEVLTSSGYKSPITIPDESTQSKSDISSNYISKLTQNNNIESTDDTNNDTDTRVDIIKWNGIAEEFCKRYHIPNIYLTVDESEIEGNVTRDISTFLDYLHKKLAVGINSNAKLAWIKDLAGAFGLSYNGDFNFNLTDLVDQTIGLVLQDYAVNFGKSNLLEVLKTSSNYIEYPKLPRDKNPNLKKIPSTRILETNKEKPGIDKLEEIRKSYQDQDNDSHIKSPPSNNADNQDQNKGLETATELDHIKLDLIRDLDDPYDVSNISNYTLASPYKHIDQDIEIDNPYYPQVEKYNNIFDVQNTLTKNNWLHGYSTLSGFQFGSNHNWKIKIKPYYPTAEGIRDIRKVGPPELPKYSTIDSSGNKVERSFGKDCPILSYSFNMGSIKTDNFRLFNSSSQDVFAGVNFNMIMTLSILDDVHNSMMKYMMKYMNFAYNPSAGTLRPFYELLFEIELVILEATGGGISHCMKLIGIPIDYSPMLEGNPDPNETRVDIVMSIVGMIPYDENALERRCDGSEFNDEYDGEERIKRHSIKWRDIQSNMISDEDRVNYYLPDSN